MDLSSFKGIGPGRLESLRAMGITSLRDLLYTLPVKYEDHLTVYPCSTDVEASIMVCGSFSKEPKLSRFNGITRVTASISDASGQLSCCWYNQPWMMQQIPVGTEIFLYGRITKKNGRRIFMNPVIVNEPGYVPVYKSVKGIPAKTFRDLIRRALEEVDDCCPESLPKSIRLEHHLCELNFAIRQAHFPIDQEALKTARRRLAFENMLMFQAYIQHSKGESGTAYPMMLKAADANNYWNSLSFMPTAAQRRVLNEILNDLIKDRPMRRLVQGDVGSGKTAVAFGAIVLSHIAGFQTAMMAPTEILAEQHYQNARKVLEPLGICCMLLTGSTKAAERKKILQALSTGGCNAIFGTHALISSGVKYSSLGLVITDEQHRFGVNQRTKLEEKGKQGNCQPHVLVMSATPIPRSLALILYGDLELSVIDELPPGRKAVASRIVPAQKEQAMYSFVRQKIREGQQVYIVCPLVEDSESLSEVKSASAVYDQLTQNELNGFRVGLTYGTQKNDEKQLILNKFSESQIDVLISTTVIEVGINVPNACIMIIQNAERFGLSQLHQLRGRVGRGKLESWCFLLTDHPQSEKLRIFCSTNDGFIIAQKDLEIRGPGDLMGTRQSGEAMLGFILDGDVRLLEETNQCMKTLIASPNKKEELDQVKNAATIHFGNGQRLIGFN